MKARPFHIKKIFIFPCFNAKTYFYLIFRLRFIHHLAIPPLPNAVNKFHTLRENCKYNKNSEIEFLLYILFLKQIAEKNTPVIPFPVVFASFSFFEPKGSLLSREKRRETRKSKRLAWPISRRYCIETDRLHTTRAKEIRFKFRVLETRSLGRRNPGMRISSIQTRHPDVSNGVRVVSSR